MWPESHHVSWHSPARVSLRSSVPPPRRLRAQGSCIAEAGAVFRNRVIEGQALLRWSGLFHFRFAAYISDDRLLWGPSSGARGPADDQHLHNGGFVCGDFPQPTQGFNQIPRSRIAMIVHIGLTRF